MKIKGAILHNKQKEIFKDIINSNAKYFTINASRQSGKSYLLAEFVRYFGLTESNKQIMYVTPTYSLGSVFFSNIVNSLRDIPVIQSINKSKLSLTFNNNTAITFKSAERPDNIRGGSYDYVFLDEFSFFKEDAWTAIKPTILAKKYAKVIIVSTPKGKNLFYDLVKLGESNNVRYKYYFMHYSDNPYCDTEEVEDAKKVLPDNVYKQEYEAEFIDDGGTVFKNISINQTVTKWSDPINGMKYFAGIDIGKVDSTVLTIMDSNNNVVYIHRINETSYDIIINSLINVLNKYNPLTYVETNGVGDVVFDLLQTKYSSLVAWTNTNKTKTDMIENLIKDLALQNINIPSKELFPDLDFELSVFTYEYNNKTRTIKYAAQPPHHDDTVISLALCNLCRTENKFTGNYVNYKHQNKFGY